MSRRDIKKKSRRDESRIRRDESRISTRIVLAYTLQPMNLEDDWFIFEYTSHSSPFLSQSIEIR